MNETELDLRGVIGMLRRQLRLIVSTVVIALALAAVVSFSLTPKFQASATIFVDTSRKDPLVREVSSDNGNTDNARVESEVEIILTDAVLMEAIRETNLVEDLEFGVRLGAKDRVLAFLRIRDAELPSGATALANVIDNLRRAITVERRGLTYLISVSVESKDPAKAALLANAIADAYIRSQVAAKIESILAARNVVASSLEAAEKAVDDSRQRFNEFIVRNAPEIASLSGKADVAETGKRLEEIITNRARDAVLAEDARRARSQANWSQLAKDLQSQAIAALDQQRAQIEASRRSAPEGSEAAINLAAELKQVEDRLRTESQAAVDRLEAAVNQADQQAAEYRNQFRTDVATQRLTNLPPKLDQVLGGIIEEGNNAQAQSQVLQQRKQDLEAQAGMQLADSRVVSPALAPAKPSSPNVRLILALAGIASLGVGVGLGVLFENFVGGFTSAGQTEAVLGARLATGVPKQKAASTDQSVADTVLDAPLSGYSESIRRLRAALDNIVPARSAVDDAARSARVIMISSAHPGEGKTTVALSLARIYALSDLNVLLIDCDMRKPNLHRHLGINAKVGLADYLHDGQNNDLITTAVAKDARTGLLTILGVRRNNLPTDQLLGGKAFARLLQAASKKFDVIVLDTPPIGPMVDGLYLAPYADAIAFVVRWARTPQRVVLDCLTQLRDRTRKDVEILTVLNAEEKTMLDYRASYGDYHKE